MHNLHHVEVFTPKPDESLDFFTRVLGLHETHREGQSVYLRGAGEWARYSTKLTEAAAPGLGHVAWQVAEPDQVQGWARRLKEAGAEHKLEEGGSHFAQGDTLSFTGPFGHRTELFYDFERYEPESASKLLSQPVRFPTPGELVEEALALYRAVGYREGEASVLHLSGRIAAADGNLRRAAEDLGRSLEIYRRIGHQVGVAETLERLAAATSDPDDADRLRADAADVRALVRSGIDG